MSIKKPGPTAEEKAKWLKLYVEERWSIEAIRRRYGRDTKAIRLHLLDQGVKIRSRRERAVNCVNADDL
jgi:hypothetical protein